jgi:hypothetical protein
VAAGNYYRAACAYAGIRYQTFLNWMRKGRKARRGPFLEFFGAVTKAQADAEVRMVAQWQAQIPENWQAARDFLARRYPRRWMPREGQELTGKDGDNLKVEVREVIVTTRAQADAVLAALTDASGVPRQ